VVLLHGFHRVHREHADRFDLGGVLTGGRGSAPKRAGARLASRIGPAIFIRVQRYDAVLVPGGGLQPGGALPPFVLNRLEAAQALAGEAPIIPLSATTFHRAPPLDAAGFPVLESVAAARALLARGVPKARIWVEAASLDTIGNAYFARVIHTDPAGLRRLLVVNSEFHMPRTQMIFDWVFGLPPADPHYALDYHTVPDRGLTEAGLEARRAKEAARMEDLRHTITCIASLAALHRWLFTEHRAYAGGTDPRSDAPPAAALEN
jgi:uncharacterized SAM-binding protein YcdF (DUF218 family)